jgi:uncharacterized protein with NRDE domain
MCTLIAMWRHHPAAPLVLALNRDEFFARPTEPLHRWSDRPIVAGRDLASGGTWFGVGRRVVAGLTNHRSGERSKPGERSRGKLVASALEADGAAEAERLLLALPGEAFGPFHLLLADLDSMRWLTNRSGRIESRAVEPGLHVLGNYGLDNPDDPVVATLLRESADANELAGEALEMRLRATLAQTGPGRPCVRGEAYGTRSAAILFWGGEEAKLLAADGPPCETPWIDRSELLRGEG